MVKLMKKGFTLVELMVVIVIIGVLAAVAIPKFMQASDKAKASEFPTVLTNISTQQAASRAEIGSYDALANIVDAKDITEMSASKWFSYATISAMATTFTATAGVKQTFGALASTDNATINETGTKTATAPLRSLVKTWQ